MLRHIAVVDGEEVLLESVAIPHITPSSGLYYEAQTVSMTTATEGAQIYYTLDGSDPTTGALLYAAPFVVEQTGTIKAFAVKANMYDSEISTVHITIQDTNSLVQLPFDISDNSTSGHEDIALMSGLGDTIWEVLMRMVLSSLRRRMPGARPWWRIWTAPQELFPLT